MGIVDKIDEYSLGRIEVTSEVKRRGLNLYYQKGFMHMNE